VQGSDGRRKRRCVAAYSHTHPTTAVGAIMATIVSDVPSSTPPSTAAAGDDDGSGSSSSAAPCGLPLTPQSSWRPPTGCTWTSVPVGNKRSPVYSYFVVQYDRAGFMYSRAYFCIHKDHKGRPTGRVVHANGVTNLRRLLKDHHDILDENRPPLGAAHSSRGRAGAALQGDQGGQAGVRAGAGRIISYFRAAPKPYTLNHSTQREFY